MPGRTNSLMPGIVGQLRDNTEPARPQERSKPAARRFGAGRLRRPWRCEGCSRSLWDLGSSCSARTLRRRANRQVELIPRGLDRGGCRIDRRLGRGGGRSDPMPTAAPGPVGGDQERRPCSADGDGRGAKPERTGNQSGTQAGRSSGAVQCWPAGHLNLAHGSRLGGALSETHVGRSSGAVQCWPAAQTRLPQGSRLGGAVPAVGARLESDPCGRVSFVVEQAAATMHQPSSRYLATITCMGCTLPKLCFRGESDVGFHSSVARRARPRNLAHGERRFDRRLGHRGRSVDLAAGLGA